jgi:hypothetical protein
MPIPGDRQDKLPQPGESLPDLSQSELAQLIRLARLAKAGHIRSFYVKNHNKNGCLDADWTEDGGGRLLK